MPPTDAFAACVALMRTADPTRRVVRRRVIPDPPEAGSMVITTLRGRDGSEREIRAEVLDIEPPARLVTANAGDGAAVRTELHVMPHAEGSEVTLISEATAALAGGGRRTAMLDRIVLRRQQRSAATATLRRLREISASSAGP